MDTTHVGSGLSPGGAGSVGIARTLGLKDFYSLFVLDYCEGFYVPHKSPNVTYCSPKSHRYTPGGAFQADLDKAGSKITLEEIGWPTELDRKFHGLYSAIDAVIAFFSVAILASLLTIIGSAWWLIKKTAGRRAILSTAIAAFVAFFFAAAAAVITTAIIYRGIQIFENYTKQLGATSLKGHKFLALVWSSMAAAFLAWILSSLGFFFGGGRRKDVESNTLPSKEA
jgi:SUR7/PalI family protein